MVPSFTKPVREVMSPGGERGPQPLSLHTDQRLGSCPGAETAPGERRSPCKKPQQHRGSLRRSTGEGDAQLHSACSSPCLPVSRGNSPGEGEGVSSNHFPIFLALPRSPLRLQPTQNPQADGWRQLGAGRMAAATSRRQVVQEISGSAL